MSAQDIGKLVKRAVEVHMTTEEIGLYINDSLNDEIERIRIQEHLKRCLICSRRLEAMKEIMEPAVKEPVKEPLREFLAKLKEDLVDWFEKSKINFFPLTMAGHTAHAATPTCIKHGETEDGSVMWDIEGEATEDLTVKFGSYRMDLEGSTIVFKVGGIEKRILLERIGSEKQLYGFAKFSVEERQNMPGGTAPQIDIIIPDNRRVRNE